MGKVFGLTGSLQASYRDGASVGSKDVREQYRTLSAVSV